MTYCLGIKLKEGIVGISDTRLTSGNETSTAEKYKLFKNGNQNLFIMTSGLRSVRDKAITYFSEALDKKFESLNKVYEAVNEFGNQIKRVAVEDKQFLKEAGLDFNINAIVGGQLKDDHEHKLFLLYPEGNWIEIEQGFPFTIIGNSGYGKPVLRRTLSYDSTIKFALKTGLLSFDSTRVSANDVDFPIDIIIYRNNSFNIEVHRFEEKDVKQISDLWGQELTAAVKNIPDEWMDQFLT
jgi:putative proteasome-type protease